MEKQIFGKQIFGKQIYAGLGKHNGTERKIVNRKTLLGPSLSTYLAQTIAIYGIAHFLKQVFYLHYFRQL